MYRHRLPPYVNRALRPRTCPLRGCPSPKAPPAGALFLPRLNRETARSFFFTPAFLNRTSAEPAALRSRRHLVAHLTLESLSSSRVRQRTSHVRRQYWHSFMRYCP